MPAYGCPDLVAATVFAGAKPLFVDTVDRGIVLDVERLEEILIAEQDLIAIIGVDLFGLSERWAELRKLANKHGLVLIQDCAQSLQDRNKWRNGFSGDIAIFSFGRGKPLYLQGGGALIATGHASGELRNSLALQYRNTEKAEPWFSAAHAVAYNIALEPHLYSLLARILGDALGKTVYKPLHQLQRAPGSFERLAKAAIERYWETHSDKAAEISGEKGYRSSRVFRFLSKTRIFAMNGLIA
jgi:hypothetical protein